MEEVDVAFERKSRDPPHSPIPKRFDVVVVDAIASNVRDVDVDFFVVVEVEDITLLLLEAAPPTFLLLEAAPPMFLNCKPSSRSSRSNRRQAALPLSLLSRFCEFGFACWCIQRVSSKQLALAPCGGPTGGCRARGGSTGGKI